MADANSSDPRYDVHHMISVFSQPTASSHGVGWLQHLALTYYDPLESSASTHNVTQQFLPGEYPTSINGQCICGRFSALTVETSLGRRVQIGTEYGYASHVSKLAPTGHELRAVSLRRDPQGVLSVLPIHSRRLRVVNDYMKTWCSAIATMHSLDATYKDLPRTQVGPFLQTLETTANRLASLDDRGVVSPTALAASFDGLLIRALHEVFTKPRTVKRAFFLGSSLQERVDKLAKLAETLVALSAQLTDAFERTERRFLTDPFFSDGTDVVPFVWRFARQPITPYNCVTALAVFTRHIQMMSQPGWEYAARLMYFFVSTGDLVHLKAVVQLQATHLNQSKADVFKAWHHCVPAVRLAIKHRHLDMLHWILLEVRLFPEDTSPLVQLTADGDDRLWTIDQLLQQRTSGVDVDTAVLTEIQLLVKRVRNARAFHDHTQCFITRQPNDAVDVSELHQLVPLITHAFNLKWLFTLVELYQDTGNRTPKRKLIQKLFTDAFHHVLREKLVLDLASAIFFHKASREARRRQYISNDTADALDICFQQTHMEGAPWARELQQQVRRTVYELDSAQSRLGKLHDSLQYLQHSLAQREQTECERRYRKQLLSIVLTLLPMVAPAFAFLEQCVSLCDPLAFVVAIIDDHVTDTADDLNVDRFLSGDDPAISLQLQEGLSEELEKIAVDANELVDMLRKVVRDDSPGESNQSSPKSNEANPNGPPRSRLRDVVKIYMEQRRELDHAGSMEATDNQVDERLSAKYPREKERAADQPTWRWYGMFTSVADYFRRSE